MKKIIFVLLCIVMHLNFAIVCTAENNNLGFSETAITVFYVEDELDNVNTRHGQMINSKENLINVPSTFSISSHIKINNVNVGESGIRIIDNAYMSCTLDITNTSVKDEKITAILVTYSNDGKLSNVRTFEVDIEAGQTISTEIIYQFDSEKEYSGKLMFWNTISNLIPIRASIDFNQISGVNAYYYNADNRLLQIDKSNGVTLIFTYDNMGNLLSKTARE